MRHALIQELLVLTAILAIAVLVFVQTGSIMDAGGSQVASGTFPRLAAGTMGVLAIVRMLMFVVKSGTFDGIYDWNWNSMHRIVSATVLMVLYILLFRLVPFAPLTFAFIFLVFLSFGVRPLKRLLISTALSAGFLTILFVYIVGIVR
ncbi:tripartite tricarboxylate transporter TctB family protein [Pararhizobium sp. IMCC21322]|uniref:tripartite tricarboxylate transporter TctB family protein n=1 Tax=Pararhizobium sp. IMCC21322 TaxID=3067903 RepID=UPI0027409F38|nr:tripartite tricarboxylate transporter TctB family protein [Pararhizobium sp. IMCC21322]